MLTIKDNGSYTLDGTGTALDEPKTNKKELTEAQKKRLEEKKKSDLPYSFDYKWI